MLAFETAFFCKYNRLFLFYNIVGSFADRAFGNYTAHSCQRIYLRISADYRAWAEDRITADLDKVSEYCAEFA